jgi:hypothetical protein
LAPVVLDVPGFFGGMESRRKGSSSFLKKRTKKLLPLSVREPASTNAKKQKSFASFLQKRRPFSF